MSDATDFWVNGKEVAQYDEQGFKKVTRDSPKGNFPYSSAAHFLSSVAHKATADVYSGKGSHLAAAIAYETAEKAHKEAMKRATVSSPYKSHEREANNHGEYSSMHRIAHEDI